MLDILKRDDNCLSLGRIMALIVFAIWCIATIYTLFLGKNYAHYDYLTYLVCFMVGGVICGKYVDAKNMALRGNL